jgi:hypothetical protein
MIMPLGIQFSPLPAQGSGANTCPFSRRGMGFSARKQTPGDRATHRFSLKLSLDRPSSKPLDQLFFNRQK